MVPGRLVELGLRRTRHSVAVAALTGDAHTGALVGLGIDEHDVADVDGPLALDDAGLALGSAGGRALVALDDVQSRDVDAVLLGVDSQHLAGLPAVLAADDDDLVVAADLQGHARAPPARGRR